MDESTRWVLEFDEVKFYGPFATKDAALNYGDWLAIVSKGDHSYSARELTAPLFA